MLHVSPPDILSSAWMRYVGLYYYYYCYCYFYCYYYSGEGREKTCDDLGSCLVLLPPPKVYGP